MQAVEGLRGRCRCRESCGHPLSSIRTARSMANLRTLLTRISRASSASSVVRQSATCKKLVNPIDCIAGFKRAYLVSLSLAMRFAYALTNSSGIAGNSTVSILRSCRKNIRSNAPVRPWPRRERGDSFNQSRQLLSTKLVCGLDNTVIYVLRWRSDIFFLWHEPLWFPGRSTRLGIRRASGAFPEANRDVRRASDARALVIRKRRSRHPASALHRRLVAVAPIH